ncbi:MAG: hypothetical protein ACF8OB_13240 [Phycisphaeraceae bacterium JB051]
MSFHTGRATFCRFAVSGDAPAAADETAISILSEFAFKEQSIGVPQEIEVGFVTGEHVFDTQFTYGKNGFGPALLFALRIDTHKVPSDIKQAYKRMHEQAVASTKDDSLGFLSKAEKREVNELTNRQLQEELAAGKYRKSKMVPILWDLKRKELFCGAVGNAIVDELHKIMRDSFNIELDQLTSGGIARQILSAKGETRDFEDIRPSAFTAPPAGATENHEDAGPGQDLSIPLVPWATASIDMKDFLGNEFLLWMWWILEEHEGSVEIDVEGAPRKDSIGILFDRTLNMDCAWEVGGKQTLTGDGPTRLVEAADALLTGKWPRKAGMIIADEGSSEQWELTFQADMMILSSVKLPDPDEAQSPRDVIEARILSCRRIAEILTGMYAKFLSVRMEPTAWATRKEAISKWIQSRKRK